MFATNHNNKLSIAGKTALLALFFSTLCINTTHASLFSNHSNNSKNNKKNAAQTQQEKQQAIQNEMLSKLFDVDDHKNSNVDNPYQFAQNHYNLSRTKLQTACRAISSFYNVPAVRDILQKIFIINTQFFKEDIKNAALAINELNELNFNLNAALRELSGIISAPGKETLETLEKVVAKIRTINTKQKSSSNMYLTGIERSIEISRAAYETYELIPNLSMQPLDMFIQSSKQLMQNTQSNSEALKGLILNIISGCEQIDFGLNTISKNVKETIKYSDHFAVKQYPLINLPAPVREKIYVQLNSLVNYVKSSENTISIGRSQVKNQSQQFTTIIGSFVDRSAESLKFATKETMPLEQISTYARNQINGLYLRVKEEINQMRAEMYKASKQALNTVPLETQEDLTLKQTKSVSADKLPLFLLGGKSTLNFDKYSDLRQNNIENANSQISNPDMSNFIRLTPKQSTQDSMTETLLMTAKNNKKDSDLFSDEDFGFEEEPKLEKAEMSIISKELNNDFFFAEKGEDISKNALIAAGEDLPEYEDDISSNTTKNKKQKSKNKNSKNNSSELLDPELEMLKFASE